MRSRSSRSKVPPELVAYSNLLPYCGVHYPTYRKGKMHALIGKKLEAVEAGKIKRLIITTPPRHGKSMLASEIFPTWYMGRNPDRYIIAATYAQDRANDTGRKVRNLMTDPSYGVVFPGVSLAKDAHAAKKLSTNHGGECFNVGVGGPVTGRGAHLFIIDDPFKDRKQADSEVYRKTLKDWFKSTAYTRLMPGGAIIIIQTRWHEDDLTGWVLKELPHENWEEIHLPALAEDNDPLGREIGEALWPDQYTREDLLKIKQTIGTREWSALYSGRPVPQEGGMINLNWFGRYNTPLDYYEQIVLSFDTAQKDKEINDPSVCLVFGVGERYYDLLDVWRERVQYPTLKRMAKSLGLKWNPNAMLIEDKSSGQSLIQELQAETTLPVLPIEPVGDKETRMSVETPVVEAGRVRLPNEAPWLVDLEGEWGTFPLSVKKDQVDSFSQFLRWMREGANYTGQVATSYESNIPQGRFF